jgi:hypothetical protein
MRLRASIACLRPARPGQRLLTREVLESIAIPELAEMVELAGNRKPGWRNCWLHIRAVQPPRVPHKPKGDVTQPLIQAVNLDEEEAADELSREELESWRQNLKGLAIRFREGLNEC